MLVDGRSGAGERSDSHSAISRSGGVSVYDITRSMIDLVVGSQSGGTANGSCGRRRPTSQRAR